MSLRMVYGRGGSGKTQYCLDSIKKCVLKHPQGTFILLTPEQSTFDAEKRAMEHMGKGNGLAVSVFSFRQLFAFLLEEMGGRGLPVLDDLEQNLIVRALLEEKKERLRVLGKACQNPGFVRELTRLINEFRSYQVAPARLRSAGGGEDSFKSRFQWKLEDISMIYQDYEALIREQWRDASGELEQLARMISESQYLKQARVWLDGFHGFTPAEFLVIQTMMSNGMEICVTLTLEGGMEKRSMREEDLFFPVWETARDLNGMAEEMRWDLLDPVYIRNTRASRFHQAPELEFLEQAWAEEDLSARWEQETRDLAVRSCANPRAEVEVCAREILRLVRERGHRFKDILVLAKDYREYEPFIQTIFDHHGIPFFEDWVRPLQYHPLLFLIRGVLDLLNGARRHMDIFACIKTGWMGLSSHEADRLENYCLDHGIGFTDWNKEWRYGDSAEASRMNRSREKIMKPLARLKRAFSKKNQPAVFSAALWAYIKETGLDLKCEKMRTRAVERNQPEEAELHIAVWRGVVHLLDQMIRVFGNGMLEPETYGQIFRTGLDQMEAAWAPQKLDQVILGTLDRTRAPEVACVLLLGVNEGVLPGKLQEEGLLNTTERTWLSEKKIQLAPNNEKKLLSESFLFYIALTRASRMIQISYVRADMEGKAMAPSPLIDDLKRIFPQLAREEGEASGSELVSSPNATLTQLAKNILEDSPLWAYVFQWYRTRPEYAPRLEKVLSGLFAEALPVRLDPGLPPAIYDANARTSVTQMERYAACPFAHFAQYGLELAERKEYRLSAPDLGRFFHQALETMFLDLKRNRREWRSSDRETVEVWAREAAQKQLPLIQNEILLSTARYRALGRNLERIVVRAAGMLWEQDQRSSFELRDVEAAFGKGKPLPGLRLELEGGPVFWLEGRMDRIDVAEDEARGKKYVRIMDYKSGRASLEPWEIYYGLKLQLLTYMAVLLQNQDCTPGGVFYFMVKDPMISKPGPISQTELQREIKRKLRLTGYLLKDPDLVKKMDGEISGVSEVIPASLNQNGEFSKRNRWLLSEETFLGICAYCVNMIKTLTKRMTDGNIPIRPWRFKNKSACQYCVYKSVCRFDAEVDGYAYRVLKHVDAEDFAHDANPME
jgi:ATP-dependent helicase/nuclease subunit B